MAAAALEFEGGDPTKTHGRWTYRFLGPGAYLRRSPSGHRYHRDGTGTTDLGRLTLD